VPERDGLFAETADFGALVALVVLLAPTALVLFDPFVAAVLVLAEADTRAGATLVAWAFGATFFATTFPTARLEPGFESETRAGVNVVSGRTRRPF